MYVILYYVCAIGYNVLCYGWCYVYVVNCVLCGGRREAYESKVVTFCLYVFGGLTCSIYCDSIYGDDEQ